MSEETRRVLKGFGISVTKLEELVEKLEGGDRETLIVSEYLDACREVDEYLAEVIRVIASLR